MITREVKTMSIPGVTKQVPCINFSEGEAQLLLIRLVNFSSTLENAKGLSFCAMGYPGVDASRAISCFGPCSLECDDCIFSEKKETELFLKHIVKLESKTP